MDMANPVLSTSNRGRERGIVAFMFTKRQLEYRGGDWVLSCSGNCCYINIIRMFACAKQRLQAEVQLGRLWRFEAVLVAVLLEQAFVVE